MRSPKLHIVFILSIFVLLACSASCSRAEPDLLWEYTIGDDACITGVSISPEGGFIAASSNEHKGDGELYGCVYLFENSGELVWKHESEGNSCNDMSISLDGNYIVVAGVHKITLFDKSQELLWERRMDGMATISISPSGQYIAVGSCSPYGDGHIHGHIYLLGNGGNILWEDCIRESYGIYVSVSSDGYLAAARYSTEPGLYLFDREGNKLWEREIGNAYVNCLSISSDGNYIAVGYRVIDEVSPPNTIEIEGSPTELQVEKVPSRYKVCLYNRCGELLWEYDTEGLLCISMSPEGDCVAVLQGQKLVLLDSRGVLQDEMDAPFCWLIGPPHISVSSHGDFIGVSAHGNLRLMNKGGKLLWEYEASHEVTDVSISRDGCSIAAGSEDGYLYFFDSDGNLLWKYQTEDDIHSVSISSDGNYIACGSLNSGEVYLLDRSGRLLWCNQLADTVRAVCVEGNYVVADSLEGTVCLLDIQGSLVWSKDIGGEWATAISVSPDGHVAAAGFTWGSPDYFYYWDREGNLLWKHESRGPSCEALAAEVSGGQYVLFGTWNDGIYCFNEAGEMLWNYATGGGRVLDILILNENNGNIVAAADVSLNLLDRQGELLGRRELIYGMSLVSVSSNSYLVAEYGNISLHELGLTP